MPEEALIRVGWPRYEGCKVNILAHWYMLMTIWLTVKNLPSWSKVLADLGRRLPNLANVENPRGSRDEKWSFLPDLQVLWPSAACRWRFFLGGWISKYAICRWRKVKLTGKWRRCNVSERFDASENITIMTIWLIYTLTEMVSIVWHFKDVFVNRCRRSNHMIKDA